MFCICTATTSATLSRCRRSESGLDVAFINPTPFDIDRPQGKNNGLWKTHPGLDIHDNSQLLSITDTPIHPGTVPISISGASYGTSSPQRRAPMRCRLT